MNALIKVEAFSPSIHTLSLRYAGFFCGSKYSNVKPIHNANSAIPFHNDSTSAVKYKTLVSVYWRVIPTCSLVRNFGRVPEKSSSVRIMARVRRALAHLSATDIQQKLASAHKFRQQQKWLIVYNTLVAPRQAKEIALHIDTTFAVCIGSAR